MLSAGMSFLNYAYIWQFFSCCKIGNGVFFNKILVLLDLGPIVGGSSCLIVHCCCRSHLYSVHCTLCTKNCTVYSVQCTLYSVHCTLYTVLFTLYTIHCTLYTVHCTGVIQNTNLTLGRKFGMSVASQDILRVTIKAT